MGGLKPGRSQRMGTTMSIAERKVRWWYTVVMLAVYLGVFHLWQPFPRGGAALFGLVVAFALFTGAVEAKRRGYFVNRFDFGFHLVVVVDLVLEALLVPVHAGHGFYGCAAAFGVVLSGYRVKVWREQRVEPTLEPADGSKSESVD